MVNRIQEILKRYNLTAAKFADQLEVPRSTISHILSERNKPSLEFIQKVLDKYPAINTQWLVKGEGSIFGKEVDLFSGMETANDAEETADTKTDDNTEDFPAENPLSKASGKDEENYQNLSEESVPADLLKNVDKEIDKPSQKENAMNRKIVRLIAFYQDNTFEEFLPAENKLNP